VVDSVSESLGEASGKVGLSLNLDALHGAEEDISDNFSTGGRNSPSNSLILDSVLLSNGSGEDVLEDLIESELSESLSRVTDECGSPSSGESSESLSDLDLVNSISNGVEEMMIDTGDKKGTVKRMFSILVEGLQNIRLHGEKDVDGNQASFLIIAQDENEYLITLANLVFNSNKDAILDRLGEINSYDEKQVKALYMEVLTNGIISNKGGAGLGFITMAMKSKNKLNFSVQEIDESLSCFSLEIKINRKKS